MWYKNIKAQNGLIILFSLAGLGCSLYFVNMKVDLSHEEKQQIGETVFSTLMDYITNHPDEDPDYYFISVSGADPSPELMEKFSDRTPDVVPASTSRMSYGFAGRIHHKSNPNKSGIKIDLDIQGGEPDGSVRVRTSIYQDRGTSATYEYVLKGNKDEFRITSVKYPDRFSKHWTTEN